MFDDFCYKSKNLYNHANYVIRNEFIKNNKWVRYNDLDKLLKSDKDYPDYKEMPTAQAAQQVLRLIDKNWKSFFLSIKDWSKNKDKYLGRPKLPKYKSKNGRNILILTNQNVKIKNGLLVFPKIFAGFVIKPSFINRDNFISFQQVRFIPDNKKIVIELVYNINISDELKKNNNYISIDIGVNNLTTICTNFTKDAFIINGKPLKSINQFYNKQISHYREVAKRMNHSDYTNRMNILTHKRNFKIADYMHKASRQIINYCLKHNVSKIIIGNNKEWKQESKLSKRINQHFVQIPYMQLIQMIQYKAREYGIEVILTEESYTSGTSFLDNEMPVKELYNKSRRICRGLFISSTGIKINADVNGSYQIMKKAFPKAFADGIEGVALHPVRVNVV